MTPRSCWLLCVLLLAFCPTAAQAAQSHPRHHDHQEWSDDDAGTPGDDGSTYDESGDPEDWYVDEGDQYGDNDSDEHSDEYSDEGDYSSDDGYTDDGEQVDPGLIPPPVVETPQLPRIPPAPVQPSMVHLHANGKVWVSPKVPRVVRRVIAAANRIAKRPYRYGGGHGSFFDRAYDCSGSVSYALHGGGLLNSTLVSGSLAHWGAKGPGRWITIYANNGHVYMVVAGMRFDTGARARTGTRWDLWMRPARGFAVRHPPGL